MGWMDEIFGWVGWVDDVALKESLCDSEDNYG